MNRRGVRRFGQQLEGLAGARTVRVRDGETLIADGPFAETKEFIGGLDIIDCENLDEAIEVAAKHPVSWYFTIEVRPFIDYAQQSGCAPESDPVDIDPSSARYLLMMCLDGIPEAPEVEEEIMRDSVAWREQVEASGDYVYGHPIRTASTATTVRVRDGKTLLTDGPFTETKEFLGGYRILSCETHGGCDRAGRETSARALSHDRGAAVLEPWSQRLNRLSPPRFAMSGGGSLPR